MSVKKKTQKPKIVKPARAPESEPEIPKQEKSNAGRKCGICIHSSVADINAQIGKSISFRDIARQFDLDKNVVWRHTNNCLELEVAVLMKERKVKHAVDHYTELREQYDFAKEIQSAAKEMLVDKRTGKVSFLPRAEETTVLFLDHSDLHPETLAPARKSASIQWLLDKIEEESNVEILKHHVHSTDYKKFVLKTFQVTDLLLDKFARVDNHYFKDKDSIDAEVATLKQKISERALSRGVSFGEELKFYLDNYSENLKPPVRLQLSSELIQ